MSLGPKRNRSGPWGAAPWPHCPFSSIAGVTQPSTRASRRQLRRGRSRQSPGVLRREEEPISGREDLRFTFSTRWTNWRAREGREPLFLDRSGHTGQGPGLTEGPGTRHVWGAENGFWAGAGNVEWRGGQGGAGRGVRGELTKRHTQGGAGWCCTGQVGCKATEA